MDKIIELKKLASEVTAIALETKTGLALDIGTGTVFVDEQDLYDLIRLLKKVDGYFLKKGE